jgi:hypothetical protein
MTFQDRYYFAIRLLSPAFGEQVFYYYLANLPIQSPYPLPYRPS